MRRRLVGWLLGAHGKVEHVRGERLGWPLDLMGGDPGEIQDLPDVDEREPMPSFSEVAVVQLSSVVMPVRPLWFRAEIPGLPCRGQVSRGAAIQPCRETPR